MAKQTSDKNQKPILERIRGFIDEVLVELKKVTWPTKEDLKSSTTVVLMLMAIMGAVCFVLDMFFGAIMGMVFKLS